MSLFDTHCHLTDPRFHGDIDDVLASASEAGVTRIMVPGISLSSSAGAARLAENHEGIFAAAGIHPGDASTECFGEMKDLPKILLSSAVIAIGETGLDFTRNRFPVQLQKDLFQLHIDLARKFGLPLIVHSRGAEEEVLEMLGDEPGIPVILHCYTGPDHLALKAADRGFFLGFTGVITYPGNGRLRELVSLLPEERILAETDSPYLTPQALRGRRNEPANVRIVAETIGELLHLDFVAASELLKENSMSALMLSPRRTDLIYKLYGRIYLNITGRCNNDCLFCVRKRVGGIGGYHLQHMEEPQERILENIVDSLDPAWSRELVFCGYGEPTMRPELLRRLAASASEKGFRVRLNTNGLCLQRLSAEETIAMLEPFQEISVSLNASCEDEYTRICIPEMPEAWRNLMDFIQLAREVCTTRLTAVRFQGVNMNSVETLAESIGLPLRKRG